jgi:hypothetical protein
MKLTKKQINRLVPVYETRPDGRYIVGYERSAQSGKSGGYRLRVPIKAPTSPVTSKGDLIG